MRGMHLLDKGFTTDGGPRPDPVADLDPALDRDPIPHPAPDLDPISGPVPTLDPIPCGRGNPNLWVATTGVGRPRSACLGTAGACGVGGWGLGRGHRWTALVFRGAQGRAEASYWYP